MRAFSWKTTHFRPDHLDQHVCLLYNPNETQGDAAVQICDSEPSRFPIYVLNKFCAVPFRGERGAIYFHSIAASIPRPSKKVCGARRVVVFTLRVCNTLADINARSLLERIGEGDLGVGHSGGVVALRRLAVAQPPTCCVGAAPGRPPAAGGHLGGPFRPPARGGGRPAAAAGRSVGPTGLETNRRPTRS